MATTVKIDFKNGMVTKRINCQRKRLKTYRISNAQEVRTHLFDKQKIVLRVVSKNSRQERSYWPYIFGRANMVLHKAYNICCQYIFILVQERLETRSEHGRQIFKTMLIALTSLTRQIV